MVKKDGYHDVLDVQAEFYKKGVVFWSKKGTLRVTEDTVEVYDFYIDPIREWSDAQIDFSLPKCDSVLDWFLLAEIGWLKEAKEIVELYRRPKSKYSLELYKKAKKRFHKLLEEVFDELVKVFYNTFPEEHCACDKCDGCGIPPDA